MLPTYDKKYRVVWCISPGHLIEQLDIIHLLLEGELVEVGVQCNCVVAGEVGGEGGHHAIHRVDLVKHAQQELVRGEKIVCRPQFYTSTIV